MNRKLKIETWTNIPSFSCTQMMCFPDTETDSELRPPLTPETSLLVLQAPLVTLHTEESLCPVFLCTRSPQAAVTGKALPSVISVLEQSCLFLYLTAPPPSTLQQGPCLVFWVFPSLAYSLAHTGSALNTQLVNY